MISVKIFSWATTCRGTPKQSSKTFSAGRKTPRYSLNRSADYDLGQYLLLGFCVSRYTEIVLKNLLRRSKKLPGTLTFAQQTMICDKIFSWGSAFRGTPKQSSKTDLASRKTPRNSKNRATDYDFRQNLPLGINVSRHTEILPKNVLVVTINPQVHSKPIYEL